MLHLLQNEAPNEKIGSLNTVHFGSFYLKIPWDHGVAVSNPPNLNGAS